MYKTSNVRSIGRRIIASFVLLAFLMTGVVSPGRYAYAQEALVLPPAGERLSLSPAFIPPVLKGIKVDVNSPLRLDFVLDKGSQPDPMIN